MEKKQFKRYSRRELSAFCMEVALLLEAGVALEEGFAIMSEDADRPWEREMLTQMADAMEEGKPLNLVLEETGTYPDYVVKLAGIGYETGSLDVIMKSLSEYYAKEHQIMQGIKDAITYPSVMVGMLMILLAVLFIKVMPIFIDVYVQLGVVIPGFALAAMRVGGFFSVALWVLCMVLLGLGGIIYVASAGGKKMPAVQRAFQFMKDHSKLSRIISKRRFTAALGLTFKSGLEWEKGLHLAEGIIGDKTVQQQAHRCIEGLEQGQSYYDAIKSAGLYSGFQLQMIKVGVRSGHMDVVMDEVAKDYEQQADMAISNMISGFEPAVVAILAVSVGTVLLSVVLPLLGVLSAVG